ncbi:MAG: protoporphyrinogen/coproporphyrinogen oxidase [Gemmatimonadales bacterium]
MTDVIVVGGGLAGLAAAYQAQREGARVTVLESERRWGGVVVTERVAGDWIVEGGPDSFLGSDGAIPALAGELSIAGRVVRQSAHGSARWTGHAVQPLSEGEAAALLGIQANPEDLTAGHLSFAGGMGDLVDALVAAVRPALRFGAGVSGIAPANGGFRLSVTGGSALTGAAVILAVPAWRAAHLLRGLAPSAASLLGDIRYVPSLTVSLAYRAEQIGAPLAGTGFVVQPDAGIPVRACTYASLKFPGRAPRGHVLLRAFLSPGTGGPGPLAHRTLAPILDIRGEPLWSRAYEWPRAIPFYGPEHAAQLAEVRRRLAGLGKIVLAGAGYDGAGVSSCVRSGREAASSLLASSTTRSTVSPSSR